MWILWVVGGDEENEKGGCSLLTFFGVFNRGSTTFSWKSKRFLIHQWRLKARYVPTISKLNVMASQLQMLLETVYASHCDLEHKFAYQQCRSQSYKLVWQACVLRQNFPALAIDPGFLVWDHVPRRLESWTGKRHSAEMTDPSNLCCDTVNRRPQLIFAIWGVE